MWRLPILAVFLKDWAQGYTGTRLPVTNFVTFSGDLLGGKYQGDGAEALAGLFRARALDEAYEPLLPLAKDCSSDTENGLSEPMQDDAVGIRITYPLNDDVLLVGDVVLTFEASGFTVAVDTPVEVFVPQNGEIPFILKEKNVITLSSPRPCTQLVTLAASVRGQRVSTSVLFSTVPDKAAILSARAPLPADAIWGPRSEKAPSRLGEPEPDQSNSRGNGHTNDQGPLGREGLDGRVRAPQRSKFATRTKGARPISLVFVGTLNLDGQKHIWLEQMERLSRARFTPKFLTFETMKNEGSTYLDTAGADDWEKHGADAFAQRVSHAGVQLITAQLPAVDVSQVSSGSSGQTSIHYLEEKLSQVILDSYDRAAGDPQLMSPPWTRDVFQQIADAIKYASPDVLVIANGKSLGDVMLTRAARRAMGTSGCKIVMDFPNLGPVLGVDVDVLATPSHYVSRHPDTEALAVSAGATVVVIPPGVRGDSAVGIPVQSRAGGGISSQSASGESIRELACADGILEGVDCCNRACHVVGFAGRLAPEKSPGLFMVVAQALAELIPSVIFVVVGDGPLRPELEATAARLGIASRVHFAGWASGDRLQRLLKGMTLLFNPSLSESETFCIINIQAMHLGTPVAAFGIGGMLEYGNLELLDDAEPRVVAAAIANLVLDRPRLDALAESGRAEVMSNFQADTALDRWALLYETLARQGTVGL